MPKKLAFDSYGITTKKYTKEDVAYTISLLENKKKTGKAHLDSISCMRRQYKIDFLKAELCTKDTNTEL